MVWSCEGAMGLCESVVHFCGCINYDRHFAKFGFYSKKVVAA